MPWDPGLEARKCAGRLAKVGSERFGRASGCSLRSSSARVASQKRFGCVLGSILRPSGLHNLCSRGGESIDFRKSAFPQSLSIWRSKNGSQNDHLHARIALMTRPKRLKSAPRRVQSASRALPDALGDAFWLSLRVSERIGHASACSVRSSSARLASQKRCGSVLGSILG